jgi:hypothetical protein
MERSNRETKHLYWFGYKDTFLALLHSPSPLLESFLLYVNKLPYGGENLTHQYTHHNFITTYSHLLHNFFTPSHYLITTLLLHTYLSSQLSTSQQSSSQLFTSKQSSSQLSTSQQSSSKLSTSQQSSSQLSTTQSLYLHTLLIYLLSNNHN